MVLFNQVRSLTRQYNIVLHINKLTEGVVHEQHIETFYLTQHLKKKKQDVQMREFSMWQCIAFQRVKRFDGRCWISYNDFIKVTVLIQIFRQIILLDF